MTKQPTKSAQIMALHKRGKTTREIAITVYKLPSDAHFEDVDRKAAYVRVVVGQRKGLGMSPHDKRWRASPEGRKVYNAAMRRYYHRHKATGGARADSAMSGLTMR